MSNLALGLLNVAQTALSRVSQSVASSHTATIRPIKVLSDRVIARSDEQTIAVPLFNASGAMVLEGPKAQNGNMEVVLNGQTIYSGAGIPAAMRVRRSVERAASRAWRPGKWTFALIAVAGAIVFMWPSLPTVPAQKVPAAMQPPGLGGLTPDDLKAGNVTPVQQATLEQMMAAAAGGASAEELARMVGAQGGAGPVAPKAPPGGQPAEAPAASAPFSPDEMTMLGKAQRVELWDTKIPTQKPEVWVFADPLCPACRNIHARMEELAQEGYRVHVIPVSVVGTEKSLPRAAGTLCQTDVVGRQDAWRGAVVSGAPKTCDEGELLVKANNDLFFKLGLRSTPTLIAGNGQVVVDNGTVGLEAFRAWVDANAKKGGQ